MGPTQHQLKLEPDEREREEEKGFVPLHCLCYDKERFVHLPLSGDLVYQMKRYRVSVRLTVPLLLQVYVCACTHSPIQSLVFCKTQAQGATWQAMRYLIDTSSLFDLLSGNGSRYSAVVYKHNSLRRGLRWKRAFRQQVTVCSKLNYRQWWKVTHYMVLYLSTNFKYLHCLFLCYFKLPTFYISERNVLLFTLCLF